MTILLITLVSIFLSNNSYSQQHSHEEFQNEHIEIKYGILQISKNSQQLNVSGEIYTESQIVENQKQLYYRLEFNENCQVINISIVSPNILTQETTYYANELLEKIQSENLHHLFHFDNELGFVTPDNCIDYLNFKAILINKKN